MSQPMVRFAFLLAGLAGVGICGTQARADLWIGGQTFTQLSDGTIFSTNPYVGHFDDTGKQLGNLTMLNEESVDFLTGDSDGTVVAYGNTLGFNTIYRFSGGTMTSVPVGGTGISYPGYSFEGIFGWNHHLFGAGGRFNGTYPFPTVLEVNPIDGTVIKTAITASSAVRVDGFDPAYNPGASYLPGALYVGTSTTVNSQIVNTIQRYFQTTGGRIVLDTSFSIQAAGDVEFKPGDDTIYSLSGNRYDASGNLLGSTPRNGMTSFTFASDGSMYASYPSTTYLYGWDYFHNGTQVTFSNEFKTDLVYVSSAAQSAPEPCSLLVLALGSVGLLVRRGRR